MINKDFKIIWKGKFFELLASDYNIYNGEEFSKEQLAHFETFNWLLVVNGKGEKELIKDTDEK